MTSYLQSRQMKLHQRKSFGFHSFMTSQSSYLFDDGRGTFAGLIVASESAESGNVGFEPAYEYQVFSQTHGGLSLLSAPFDQVCRKT